MHLGIEGYSRSQIGLECDKVVWISSNSYIPDQILTFQIKILKRTHAMPNSGLYQRTGKAINS